MVRARDFLPGPRHVLFLGHGPGRRDPGVLFASGGRADAADDLAPRVLAPLLEPPVYELSFFEDLAVARRERGFPRRGDA